MRPSLVLIACVFVLGFVAGCGDDECDPYVPVVSEEPLAQISITGGGGAAYLTDTLRINFVSSSYDTLFNLLITAADEGTARMIDAATYPAFADAAARLADGVNDQWTFWVRLYPSSSGGGWGTSETNWIDGGLTGEYVPDLLGAEITKARLILDRVDIVADAGYTNYDIEARIVIIGKP